MAEPIYSPDGNFIWDGSQWVPVSPINKQTVDMQDSVIGGDVVSNTIIQSSDAEVIKVAMDGVVASIREMNQPQIGTAPPPFPIAPTQTFSSPIQQNTSSKQFSAKRTLVAVSIVGILLLATIVAITFLRGDDLTAQESSEHPIVGYWQFEDEFTAEFTKDGAIYVDDFGTFVWDISDGSLDKGIINTTLMQDLINRYEIFQMGNGRSILVMHGIEDGGSGCDMWISQGASFTNNELDSVTTSFCNIRNADEYYESA